MAAESATGAELVRYQRRGEVAVVTMDRPQYRNAQNSAMTHQLDDAFYRACEDDLMGLHAGLDPAFGLHHLAYAHHAETDSDPLAGMGARGIRDAVTRSDRPGT